MIRSIDADVVCCQEVDDGHGLAAASGYPYYYYGVPTDRSRGLIIMSKTPVTNTRIIQMDATIKPPPENVATLFGEVQGLTIACTHLNGGDLPASNEERINHIDEIIAGYSGEAIICGDFNHITGRLSYDYALTKLDDAGGIGNTTAADKRDFIYLAGKEARYAYITDDIVVSDHKPLQAGIS